jgi:hypothetical protein
MKKSNLYRCYCRFHTGKNPLPVDRFGKDKNQKRGIYPYCKECQSYLGFLKRHDLIEIEEKYK